MSMPKELNIYGPRGDRYDGGALAAGPHASPRVKLASGDNPDKEDERWQF
jgi:hypothetical protein